MNLALSTSVSTTRDRLIEEALALAIEEDLGDGIGDITTNAIVDSARVVTASVLLKQEAVVAGLRVFALVLSKFDSTIRVEPLVGEGQHIDTPPYAIATVKGPARAVLTGERLALNLLQRMSGIATLTKDFVELAKPFGISIRDTRKTTPGLRAFEREAVALAGGENHRFGLFDAILIKDNHIQTAGDIGTAIEMVRSALPDKPIEVEACTLAQVKTALDYKVHAILLDNMSSDMVRKAIALIDGKSFIEVSGGVNATNIKNYLIPGVNAISIGALTHSAQNIDISLEVEI